MEEPCLSELFLPDKMSFQVTVLPGHSYSDTVSTACNINKLRFLCRRINEFFKSIVYEPRHRDAECFLDFLSMLSECGMSNRMRLGCSNDLAS